MSILITDYIIKPNVEKSILGNKLLSYKKENFKKTKILLVWHQRIDNEYLSNFPNLELIVRYGVGYDQIDLKACKKRQILVCNTPDYGTDEVSDTALAMIMSFTRGIYEYNTIAKTLPTNWQENTIKGIKRTSEINVGIVGAGRIGSALILKLNSIGFQTSFYDPYVRTGYEKVLRSNKFDDLNKFLKQSDIVSLHCPLNNNTKGIVDDNFLSLMKAKSFLINTARGGLIDSLERIYDFLKKEKIMGVGFDVLPEEPPCINNLLIKQWLNDKKYDHRIIINPHTAYYSNQSYTEMRRKASINALRYIKGLDVYNKVY